jgi:carbonic anhydrase
MKNLIQNENEVQPSSSRRSLLKKICGAGAIGVTGALSLGTPEIAYAEALTEDERDKLTPDQIIQELKEGNLRFRHGKRDKHDYLSQKKSSIQGQYPSAIILSCIDSRAPAEIILDTGIGEAFVTRVAGNVSNDDILGSMEYACAVAGAKVIVVMGHTSCGAIKGAIEGVKLGNLTGLLEKIKPAIDLTEYEGERTAHNNAFVDEVSQTNVELTIKKIRKGSKILSDLEKEGKIKMIGAMYRLNGGRAEFLY